MYRIPAHIKIIAGKQQPGWTDSMWNNEIYQQNSREKYQKIYGIKQHRAFSYSYHKNAAGETFVARTPAALMFDFVLCQHFYLHYLFFRIFPHNLQSEFKISSVLHAKIMQDKTRKQGL